MALKGHCPKAHVHAVSHCHGGTVPGDLFEDDGFLHHAATCAAVLRRYGGAHQSDLGHTVHQTAGHFAFLIPDTDFMLRHLLFDESPDRVLKCPLLGSEFKVHGFS